MEKGALVGLEREFLGRTSTLCCNLALRWCANHWCAAILGYLQSLVGRGGRRDQFSAVGKWKLGKPRVEEKSLVVVVVTTRKESSGICCSFQD